MLLNSTNLHLVMSFVTKVKQAVWNKAILHHCTRSLKFDINGILLVIRQKVPVTTCSRQVRGMSYSPSRRWDSMDFCSTDKKQNRVISWNQSSFKPVLQEERPNPVLKSQNWAWFYILPDKQSFHLGRQFPWWRLFVWLVAQNTQLSYVWYHSGEIPA